MTKAQYGEIESYMHSQMRDSAHDRHHVYRVLNAAIDIANHMDNIDMEVLIAACLLHDIGREEQAADLELCHAAIGAEKAYDFLRALDWPEQKARHVRECISTHRFRKGNAPESLEAKILFDADKLDVTGAVGIARTLIYGGQVGEPLYIIDDDGNITLDGGGAEISSFIQEYHYKIKKLYGSFFTEHAGMLAAKRQKSAADFYEGLYAELTENYSNGMGQYNWGSPWLEDGG